MQSSGKPALRLKPKRRRSLPTTQAQAAKLVEDAHATVAGELAQARENEQQIVESLAESLLSRAIGPGVAA